MDQVLASGESLGVSGTVSLQEQYSKKAPMSSSTFLHTFFAPRLASSTLCSSEFGKRVGRGGTFALYSLICRSVKASLLPNQLPSDAHISSFRLKVPSPELERSLKIKEHLEKSIMLKKLLLVLVLFGTSMVIADGVVTPAMSVMSAFNGLKVGISSVEQGNLLASCYYPDGHIYSESFGLLNDEIDLEQAKLGLLWVQHYSYGFAHLEALEFITFKVRSIIIDNFLQRNIEIGSEAMFADLCYFSIRSVQFTFVFLVLPCLLLGYLGQGASLMENLTQNEWVFFSSIPRKLDQSISCICVISLLSYLKFFL
ncbi:hypothetical protein ZIOFF_058790 [Zingiber officinale]|uniref:K+ potassium transporter integral membrane domain-containing protein n=1 Tax=Zingiber officinale TaxID=94328 RepID=A0A8J5F8G2_ZINOF|nr:hypothetical protein ZIOFF_058790 [Zingiber officinale]